MYHLAAENGRLVSSGLKPQDIGTIRCSLNLENRIL